MLSEEEGFDGVFDPNCVRWFHNDGWFGLYVLSFGDFYCVSFPFNSSMFGDGLYVYVNTVGNLGVTLKNWDILT